MEYFNYPALLPQYDLVRKIAQGGMGTLYQAQPKGEDRSVVLKLIDERFTDFAVNEVNVLRQLDHPNIIKAHPISKNGMSSYVGTIDVEARQQRYIMLDYIEGQSLHDYIRAQEMIPFRNIVDVFEKLAAPVDYMHQKGFVHLDIKPSNILLRKEDEQLVLVDFGLAHNFSESTTVEIKAGTPLFMSPEQHTQKEVDPRSDIFSLGMTLAVMANKNLISIYQKTALTSFNKLIWNEQGHVSDRILERVAPPLQPIIQKALNYKKEERYQSAAELVTALRSVESKELWRTRWRKIALFLICILLPFNLVFILWLIFRVVVPNGIKIFWQVVYFLNYSFDLIESLPPLLIIGLVLLNMAIFIGGVVNLRKRPHSDIFARTEKINAKIDTIAAKKFLKDTRNLYINEGLQKFDTDSSKTEPTTKKPTASDPLQEVETFAVAQIEGVDEDTALNVNNVYKLLAGVLRNRPSGLRVQALRLPDIEVVEIDITVRALGFDIAPNWYQQVKFIQGRDSGLVEFTLTPKETGNQKIEVEFYYERHWLTTIVLDVTIVEPKLLGE